MARRRRDRHRDGRAHRRGAERHSGEDGADHERNRQHPDPGAGRAGTDGLRWRHWRHWRQRSGRHGRRGRPARSSELRGARRRLARPRAVRAEMGVARLPQTYGCRARGGIAELDTLVAAIGRGLPVQAAVTARLLTYDARYAKLARDHTRDPAELQQALVAIAAWPTDIATLDRQMYRGPSSRSHDATTLPARSRSNRVRRSSLPSRRPAERVRADERVRPLWEGLLVRLRGVHGAQGTRSRPRPVAHRAADGRDRTAADTMQRACPSRPLAS